jgi:hypothetical protein
MNTRPALPVRERRADDPRPYPRIHVGVFVEHHAVEIDAAHGVGIVGAVEPHLPAVDVVDAQLALVRAGADRAARLDRRAQIIPRHRLRLAQERREIGVARPRFLRSRRAAVQIVDAGHGLAGAAVRHDAGEALPAAVEGDELPARLVVDEDGNYSGSFH